MFYVICIPHILRYKYHACRGKHGIGMKSNVQDEWKSKNRNVMLMNSLQMN